MISIIAFVLALQITYSTLPPLVAAATMACNNSPSLCDRAWSNTTQLGCHNSPFVRDATTDWSYSGNQYYNTTVQLSAGVRFLTGQMHYVNTTANLHLCHSSCDLLDAGTVSNWLSDIKTWLDDNPYDVVTLLLTNDDDVSTDDIATEFADSGITKYAYTPTDVDAPPADGVWPTLAELINNGTRLITFIGSLESVSSSASYLLDQDTFIFSNSYDYTNLTSFSCSPASPSSVAGSVSAALDADLLPLQNHYVYTEEGLGIEIPDVTDIYTTNAPSSSSNSSTGSLGQSAQVCAAEYGRAATFLVVDFFNIGPAIDTVDTLNGVTDVTGRSTTSTAILTTSDAVRFGHEFLSMKALLLIAATGMYFMI